LDKALEVFVSKSNPRYREYRAARRANSPIARKTPKIVSVKAREDPHCSSGV
jgi:hypothetical protein